MLEQAEEDLDAQDVAHGVVDGGFLDLAGADQLLQVGDEPEGHHVHVHPGVQRLPRHFAAVGAIAVGNHLAHRVPVGDHQAVKAPLAAQDVAYDELVARRRHAVVVVERGHQRQRARLDGRLEGRQVDVAQLVFRQEGAVVVAPALGGAVTHEVLDAGRHRGRVPLRALVAAHHGLAHPGVQPGVFAAAFRHAAPAGVAGDVEHRREGPADALRRRLDGGHAGALLHQRRVEGRGEAQRDRENRMETVDHVASHQQGDREPRLFHRDALQLIDPGRVHHVEDGPDLPAAHRFGIVVHAAVGRDLVHLADLLGQGHLREDLLHAALHLRRRAHRGRPLRAATGSRRQARGRQE